MEFYFFIEKASHVCNMFNPVPIIYETVQQIRKLALKLFARISRFFSSLSAEKLGKKERNFVSLVRRNIQSHFLKKPGARDPSSNPLTTPSILFDPKTTSPEDAKKTLTSWHYHLIDRIGKTNVKFLLNSLLVLDSSAKDLNIIILNAEKESPSPQRSLFLFLCANALLENKKIKSHAPCFKNLSTYSSLISEIEQEEKNEDWVLFFKSIDPKNGLDLLLPGLITSIYFQEFLEIASPRSLGHWLIFNQLALEENKNQTIENIHHQSIEIAAKTLEHFSIKKCLETRKILFKKIISILSNKDIAHESSLLWTPFLFSLLQEPKNGEEDITINKFSEEVKDYVFSFETEDYELLHDAFEKISYSEDIDGKFNKTQGAIYFALTETLVHLKKSSSSRRLPLEQKILALLEAMEKGFCENTSFISTEEAQLRNHFLIREKGGDIIRFA